MTSTRCFLQIRGRRYALMNWKARLRRTDAFILRVLSPHEEALFQSMKRDGVEEATIFTHLYSPPVVPAPAQEVRLPVALLTKAQLTYVIENKLGVSMPSLKKMHKVDLTMLLDRL